MPESRRSASLPASRRLAATATSTKQALPTSTTDSRLRPGLRALLRAAAPAIVSLPPAAPAKPPRHQRAKAAKPAVSSAAPTPKNRAGDACSEPKAIARRASASEQRCRRQPACQPAGPAPRAGLLDGAGQQRPGRYAPQPAQGEGDRAQHHGERDQEPRRQAGRPQVDAQKRRREDRRPPGAQPGEDRPAVQGRQADAQQAAGDCQDGAFAQEHAPHPAEGEPGRQAQAQLAGAALDPETEQQRHEQGRRDDQEEAEADEQPGERCRARGRRQALLAHRQERQPESRQATAFGSARRRWPRWRRRRPHLAATRSGSPSARRSGCARVPGPSRAARTPSARRASAASTPHRRCAPRLRSTGNGGCQSEIRSASAMPGNSGVSVRSAPKPLIGRTPTTWNSASAVASSSLVPTS